MAHLTKTYGLERPPKTLPCRRKCSNNPWCIAELKSCNGKAKVRPTEQPRDFLVPVGLQNTANTCWINSALQALFHIPKFRNAVMGVGGFGGDGSLSSLLYLLQAMFVEMDTHPNKAIACSPNSLFEKLALYATREVMHKDADHEVLKCVSEFLENTIDTLIAEPRLGPELSQLFSTSLRRIARWKCPACSTSHESQIAPATSYTMAAYVSADECPLDQCLVDLQTETQTGVSLHCQREGVGGCGSMVLADRVVTPKIEALPSILVIRNNSLIDRDLKRRLHVVYPESLDLSPHTLHATPATYHLAAVIFHHGHWVKHFSAHVRTGDNKWYNFNDEQVSELSGRTGNGNPTENNKNYFSTASVANKYKHRGSVRVSRGAFVWLYVLASPDHTGLLPPPEPVLEYVLRKQEDAMTVNHQLQADIRREKEALLEDLSVKDLNEEYVLVPEPLLTAWFSSDEVEYRPDPALLTSHLCEHRLFNPKKCQMFKCVRRAAAESLVTLRCGVHVDGARVGVGLSVAQGTCRQCVARAANHILFIEKLKNMHKQAKKEAKKEHEEASTVIGLDTLEFWPRLALTEYVKQHGLDQEEEDEADKKEEGGEKKQESLEKKEDSLEKKEETVDKMEEVVDSKNDLNGCGNGETNLDTKYIACDSKSDCDKSKNENESQIKDKTSESDSESTSKGKTSPTKECQWSRFNEELVCPHNLLSPSAASCRIPKGLATEIIELCKDAVHPAMFQEDFSDCAECGARLEDSVRASESGRHQKKQLAQLFAEKRRPHPSRDPGKEVFVLAREFVTDWKSYVRSCERGEAAGRVEAPETLDNSPLLCPHGALLYPVMQLQPHQLSEYLVLAWAEEWAVLTSLYTPTHVITANYTDAVLTTNPGVCTSGCVESRARLEYEEQFRYECELINVRQVNSEGDIPRRNGRTRGEDAARQARKKPRLETSGVRLVRASKTFSSTDTVREVQNFIAERTGIWPMLQTLWVCGEDDGQPTQLTDDHRAMTLAALRVKPADTIYFRACEEDLQRAAEYEDVEYNVME